MLRRVQRYMPSDSSRSIIVSAGYAPFIDKKELRERSKKAFATRLEANKPFIQYTSYSDSAKE
ncbi:hypothetical protein KAU87_03880 [Candidatus Bathyarchaeota archaeon]|nr:hypothetical protein [Candidatus Bathyarchaeota archaeon]